MSLSEMETYLQPFLDQEGIKNAKITIEGNTEKGDGYIGDITFLNVAGQKENIEKTYNLVVKTGKKDPKIRNMMPIRDAFINEITVYNFILPEMKKFQEEKNIQDLFDNYAKCYYTFLQDDAEGLVLQNMKTCNYSLNDRHYPMSKQLIKDVLKAYAKFHALSFAIRDQKPKLFEKFTESLLDMWKLFAQENTKELFCMDKIIEIANKHKKYELAKKVANIEEFNVSNFAEPDNYSVITHGDCWNNNFIFKFSDEKRTNVEHVCILDLQISRLSSPILDLSYFLFSSTEPSDLLENFDELLECYYGSFSDFLSRLGSDPQKLFPFEAFMEEWKKYGVFGLYMIPAIMKICLNEDDEVKDLTDLKDDGSSSIGEIFSYEIKNSVEYERRILPPAELLAQRGYI